MFEIMRLIAIKSKNMIHILRSINYTLLVRAALLYDKLFIQYSLSKLQI